MNRYLIICDTEWCGTQETYSAWAESDSDPSLLEAASFAAYDNFCSFPGGGFSAVLDNLYGTENEDDLSAEELEQAYEAESNYFNFHIEDWDESRDEAEWDYYELIYDGREENDTV